MKALLARILALFAKPPVQSAAVVPPIAPPMSAHDRDILIRTVFGEARGETPAGQRAVVHVIRNRVLARGTSAAVECQRKWQFSAWNPGDPNRELMERMRPSDAAYVAIGQVVDIAWLAPDMVAGARHYYSPVGMDGVRPAWARPPGREVARIGGHVFWAGVA